MIFVNLTPHAINIRAGDRTEDYPLPPSGTVARVASTPGADLYDELYTVPLRAAQTWGEVTGLPEPKDDGTAYVVSALVAARVRREDVYSPDTGPDAIRDDQGRILAVRRLIRSI